MTVRRALAAARLLAAALPLLLAVPALARHGTAPRSFSPKGLVPLEDVEVLDLPFVDNQALLDEDAKKPKSDPLRYALVADVLVTPATQGTWDVLPDGSRLWRLRVHSPGATDLNFGFTLYELPQGATLHAWSEGEQYYEGPYTAADNRDYRQLWTPVIPGDRGVIELWLPAQAPNPALELGAVGHGYRDLFGRLDQPVPNSGSCNVDVICPQGDPWRDEINSAAVYSTGGTAFCSGTMIMDVPRDFRPYFLTANHCGMNAGNSPSMVVYWNFQTTTCGGPRDGSMADNTTGATFRAALAAPDFCLVELAAQPDPAFNVYWAGWDRTDAEFTGSVGIHHPNCDEKAITFNNDLVTHWDSCIGAGTNTHWHIDNYELGTTEPGSSGSGLWRQDNHLLVGQLSGGAASCTVIDYDCYGRFGVGWATGTTPATRLKDWLDPLNAGDMTVPGAYPAGIVGRLDLVSHRGLDSCSAGAGDANGAWEPGETVAIPVTLRAIGTDMLNVQGTLTSATPGVTITDGTATWPDVARNATAETLAPHFSIDLDPAIACGTTLSFHLHVTSDSGGPFDYDFTDQVGLPLAPNVPVPIQDTATSTSTLDVVQAVTIAGLGVRVRLTHSYVGDLTVRLTSPAGTTITLFDQPANGSGTCGDADLDATFLDGAATDAQSHCAGTGPWLSGDARPQQALAAFDGQTTTGRWTLTVVDNSPRDTGTIEDWGLVTTPALAGQCTACGAAPCLGAEMAPADLRARKGAGGSVVLTFPMPVLDTCVTGVEVRMAGTCRPAAGAGTWPTDPAFADVTAQDTDASSAFAHVPSAGNKFYLVCEHLADGTPGPSGSY